MNGIQYIGFAHAVEARQAIETLGEVQLLAFVIFKMRKFERSEVQGGAKLWKCEGTELVIGNKSGNV